MRLAILCLLAGATVGCAQSEPSPESQKKPPATAAPLAADMCKEHGVLEAVCTKCNPKLVPVFQAKGDWCAEHGFPESFCPICHPERGGRPAEAVSASDGAPADGTKVRFKTTETAPLAGIQTVTVEQRPGGARLSALARLAFDATKRAEINARAAGVVREINADIGARVQAGDTLAVIESAAVGADQSRVRAAESRVRAAEATYEREQKLVETGVSSRRDALSAHTDLDAARAELESLRASLGMVGGTGGSGRYTLRAPLAGVVIRRQASIGRLVDPEELLFEVADTSTMWAEIDVPEREAARVEIGQEFGSFLAQDRDAEGQHRRRLL
jgi:cobalt-zinc-cadmium efflux system membrane fusion protein